MASAYRPGLYLEVRKQTHNGMDVTTLTETLTTPPAVSQVVKQLSSWFNNASEQFDSAVMPRERVRNVQAHDHAVLVIADSIYAFYAGRHQGSDIDGAVISCACIV